ncbi:MAG: hypothetical protein JWQ87_1021 [Candidatus Sulfotelmatobacter sp.]|nr:hypothetical protein [Candidatus Sulfotelmatobacter sp.]
MRPLIPGRVRDKRWRGFARFGARWHREFVFIGLTAAYSGFRFHKSADSFLSDFEVGCLRLSVRPAVFCDRVRVVRGGIARSDVDAGILDAPGRKIFFEYGGMLCRCLYCSISNTPNTGAKLVIFRSGVFASA